MKTIYVDFSNQSVTNIEKEKAQELHSDPVMRRLQEKIDPAWWEVYKTTIEHYWQECFFYQLEQEDGKMYNSDEAELWENE